MCLGLNYISYVSQACRKRGHRGHSPGVLQGGGQSILKPPVFKAKILKKTQSQNSLYTDKSEIVPDWVLKGNDLIILLEDYTSRVMIV